MLNESPHVLIVDDDNGIRELLADYLNKQGMRVTTAADGREMDNQLQYLYLKDASYPDLIVMDLMLPGEDGLSLTRRVKATHDVPIIMLSARGEDIDRIVGLEVGADDYLAKPFNPRELLARIRAVLRRKQSASTEANEAAQLAQDASENAHFGPFLLNLSAQVLARDGAEIPLTQAEFSLLKLFVERPNRALSRDQIMDYLKGYECDPFNRSIDIRVMRLRKKLENDPSNPVYIRTVWGQGYLFSPKGKVV